MKLRMYKGDTYLLLLYKHKHIDGTYLIRKGFCTGANSIWFDFYCIIQEKKFQRCRYNSSKKISIKLKLTEKTIF